MIYAYGICESTTAVANLRGRGLGGASLRALASGRLAAVYSRHRSLRVRPVAAQVLRHERVVEALMTRGPVLPLRFGNQLRREDQLAATLEQHCGELCQALDRVRGRVELGVRVIPERIAETRSRTGAESGRAMVLALVEEHQRAERLARRLHAPLAEFAVASRSRSRPRPPAILVAFYLVDEDRVAAFRERAHRLAAGLDATRVLVTGPWPPYSFTTADRA